MKTFRRISPFFLFVLLPTLCLAKPISKDHSINVLFITLDDMNWDSLGCTGCKLPNISPHMDKLASEGMRFEHAHVTIGVCQPTRSVWLTGRYPHNNGAFGFEPITQKEPTLTERLRQAGYYNGIFAKVGHLDPIQRFAWDHVVKPTELKAGRDPQLYYQHAKKFFANAQKAGKPFFLMANSQDPHRPFAVKGQDKNAGKGKPGKPKKKRQYPGVSKRYLPKEITVPAFLPDLPNIRLEISEYFTSVHRADEIVGSLLKALKESGEADNTLVVLMSDHGMPLPFAKTNCYLQSTRTPLIVRWPGHVKGGVVDKQHMVSGIDFAPTVIAAAGLKPLVKTDGRSYVPLLLGKKQKKRDQVYTVFHKTSGKKSFEMRSVITKKMGYIYNAWSNGQTAFRNESQSGRTWKAMKEAAKTDPKIAARVKLFSYRVKEELFDYENDPCALNNLINDPKYKATAEQFRRQTLKKMRELKDPLLKTFQKEIPIKSIAIEPASQK